MNFFVFNLFGEYDEMRHFVGNDVKLSIDLVFSYIQTLEFKDVFENKRNVSLVTYKRIYRTFRIG